MTAEPARPDRPLSPSTIVDNEFVRRGIIEDVIIIVVPAVVCRLHRHPKDDVGQWVGQWMDSMVHGRKVVDWLREPESCGLDGLLACLDAIGSPERDATT